MTGAPLFADLAPAARGALQRPELKLYPHQAEVLERVRAAFRRGHRRTLLVMPTGAGKSETAADMLRRTSLVNGIPSVFAVHRRTLVDQFSKRLAKYGIPHGVLMAGRPYALHEPIQVASIDTLDARYFRDPDDLARAAELPNFGLIVYDEAHTHADKFARFADQYPNAWVIGLTATPALPDGRGLGEFGYSVIAEGPSVAWLMERGYLVGKVRYYGPEAYDYSGVKVGRSGEYVESSADEVVNRPELIGNVVEQYLRLGRREPFVVFANSVAHSMNLTDAFNEIGLPTVHIDANTPADERERAYSDLEAGRVLGLSNYGILDRGFDAPRISVCILARKVRHISTYRQMVGRVLRTYPGKEECIIIDHGGNVALHGFVDDEIAWTLDSEANISERERERRERMPEEERPVTCPACSATFSGSRVCPECGAELPRPAPAEDTTEHTGDDLAEITREGTRKTKEWTAAEKEAWYAQLLHIARDRKYSEGWAAHTYRKKFGVWPARKQGIRPQAPTDEVLAFARSTVQAYARRRAYAKRAAEKAA